VFTENFFTLLLNLEDGWSVSSIKSDLKASEVYIKIECQLREFTDPETGDICKLYDHAPERTWRHLDTMQYKTYITCRLPRMRTRSGKVKTVNPCWASGYERHTYLFEHAVIDLLKASKNQTKTAELMRCSFDVVNRIIHLSTERGMSRRALSSVSFDHLSIDEKSFKKGHKYITVLSQHHEELKHSRYALLKNKENLTEQQRIKFEAISEANYEVSRAWQVRENFKDLFSSNLTSGFILYARWAANSIGKKIKEITKVVDIFNNHMRGVINALIFNFNNAMAERLNGKIQEIKTVGRGYRTFKNFRSAILFFHGGLSLYPLNYQ
jgi:transposase